MEIGVVVYKHTPFPPPLLTLLLLLPSSIARLSCNFFSQRFIYCVVVSECVNERERDTQRERERERERKGAVIEGSLM